MKVETYHRGGYRGHEYLVKRINDGYSGWFCGYVRLPYPSEQALDEEKVDVHGGLTFGGALEGETGYWLGFDCAHAGDEGKWKLDGVIQETHALIDQLADFRSSIRGRFARLRALLH